MVPVAESFAAKTLTYGLTTGASEVFTASPAILPLIPSLPSKEPSYKHALATNRFKRGCR
ncbi:hypothetical protein BN903_119 [Halorubrum sp. AJ67]|nr:hypothetical protein BN903_119 [Halorubrum sp. AJ67]